MLASGTEISSALLTDLLVILAASALAALAMQRLRIAAIPAYLLTGACVGPSALGIVRSSENLEAVSYLAIILLMFGIGLQLDMSELRRGVARMIAIGVGACVLCTLAGWPAALAFGQSAPAALAISMALALSSTAVVLRILTARREMKRASGRLALTILIVQDLAVLAMFAALPAVAGWAAAATGAAEPRPVWSVVLRGELLRFGGMVLLVLAGNFLLPRLVRESLRNRSLEVMMIVSVAAALGAAALTQALGFSLEMGAFLAGFLLARTPFRHQLAGQIAPLRDLFIAVFFTTVGMKLNLSAIADAWWTVLAGTAVLLALKALLLGGLSWSFGATAGTAVFVGLALAQAGEFSLVLLDQSSRLGLLGEAPLAVCVAVVVVSLVVTPWLITLGRWWARRDGMRALAPWVNRPVFGETAEPAEDAAADGAGGVIVAGYGPMGRLVAQNLRQAGQRCTIIELNPDTVRAEQRGGKAIVFGDATNAEVLHSAGIERAAALLLTFPDAEAGARACALARRLNPDVYIVARADIVRHVRTLMRAGADYVTADEVAVAEPMIAQVLKQLQS